ncbi:MAG: chromate transporter, partial [Candidatus Sulfotelmatobacter sp.]
GGLAGMLVERARAQRREARAGAKLSAGWTLLKKSFLFPPFAAAAVAPAAKRVPLAQIALFFLKVGAVLYGGGYVLFAFVEHGLVHDHPWLTHHQVLDAIAVGQFTPGPVLSTATFIGYLLGGGWGAAVATLAIFLPSFLYVAALGPWLPRLRRSPWMAAFLNSVNVCAVALMAAVTVRLAIDALRGWPAWVIALAGLAALWKWKVNPAWIVLGGSLAGMAFSAIR